LRIAYISYEYPPDTAFGGIATYVYQVADMMLKRGHDVEVFCASPSRTLSEQREGITVHRVLCTSRSYFNQMILPVFEAANSQRPFDVIESPEFSGDGLAIKQKYNQIPLVVKLHIPRFFIDSINNTYLTVWDKARFMLSGLIRGKWYPMFWKAPDTRTDPDYIMTTLADQIHTPSVSLGDIVSAKWGIPRTRILNIPNLYVPGPDLLNIPIGTETNTITYIGRLEVRKGLVNLGKAIATVLKKKPAVKFKFVGSIQKSPVAGLDMKAYLLVQLKAYKGSLEFLQVPADRIAEVYANTDICVFPSIWENFPYSCLEAMSAGRGVVASREGGMRDMIADCEGGILIDPGRPAEIAKALIRLLDDKELRMQMGRNARQKVTDAYNSEIIGSLIEENFNRLIG